MKVVVFLDKKINRSPALRYIIGAWCTLNDLGYTSNDVPVSWDDCVVYAVVEGSGNKIVGACSFSYSEWQDEIFIKIGFVDSECRGQGIYKKLFAKVIEYAKEKDAKTIAGGRITSNVVKQAVDAAMDRKDQFMVTRYEIK